MIKPSFDLQAHSTYSDGDLAAREVVAVAAAAGVRCLALSDHDTVDGVDEALTAARAVGLDLVPATELSIVDEAGPDLHILGYGLDHRDPALLAALECFRADRLARLDRMVANLREAGLQLDERELAVRRADGLPIGRPHLATAVLRHSANTRRLVAERIASVANVICAYLIEGTPGFATRQTPSAREAITVIHDAGGIAVWAHPFWDVEDPARVLSTLDRFAALGLDGVEAFYVTHGADQAGLLADAAMARRLLTTGSSDFHGPEHPLLSSFLAFELYGLEPNLGPLTAQSPGY